MATYVIGDVQGCWVELEKLLAVIEFHVVKDTLWFTGDLVNRGPQSLEVLRFVKSLGEKHICVLGNHDLHLLAVAYDTQTQHPRDTLAPILKAPDRDSLINWLRYRPLFFYDARSGFALAHAGIAPAWDVQQAKQCAYEVEAVLQGNEAFFFLRDMYGNQPDRWSNELHGIERLRCITNYFTRMRYCYPDGRLELSCKAAPANKPPHLIPWFEVPARTNATLNIVFGHWAALNGRVDVPHVYPMDTGCVWGNCLTAMRLEDRKRFHVPCAVP